MRAWQAKNREHVREANRLWGRKNKELKRIRNIARRALEAAAPGRHTLAEWKALVELHGGRCFYCGDECAMTHEHVVALASGGSNAIDNIVPACISCNCSKRHTDVAVWLRKRIAVGLSVRTEALVLLG